MKKSENSSERVGKAVLPTDAALSKFSKKEIDEVLRALAIEKIKINRVIKSFSEAFSDVEKIEDVVRDVIVDARTFNHLRFHHGGVLEIHTDYKLLKNGLFGSMWGAWVWVDNSVEGIHCFKDKSEELRKLFPKIYAYKDKLDKAARGNLKRIAKIKR